MIIQFLILQSICFLWSRSYIYIYKLEENRKILDHTWLHTVYWLTVFASSNKYSSSSRHIRINLHIFLGKNPIPLCLPNKQHKKNASNTRIEFRINPRRLRRLCPQSRSISLQQSEERDPSEENNNTLCGECPGPAWGCLPGGDEEL